jgi:hypothetical protein
MTRIGIGVAGLVVVGVLAYIYVRPDPGMPGPGWLGFVVIVALVSLALIVREIRFLRSQRPSS